MAVYYCPSCGKTVDTGFASHATDRKGFANPAYVQYGLLIKIEFENR